MPVHKLETVTPCRNYQEVPLSVSELFLCKCDNQHKRLSGKEDDEEEVSLINKYVCNSFTTRGLQRSAPAAPGSAALSYNYGQTDHC